MLDLYDYWAIRPEMLDMIAVTVAEWQRSGHQPAAALSYSSQNQAVRRAERGVFILPIYGILRHRSSIFSILFGGTSTQRVIHQLREAVTDPSVGTVILDIDSPGGTVSGIQELAEEILNARNTKRVVAVANSEAASAAYWLASQATEMVVSPSGQVGSIGVVTMHADYSKFLEMKGIKPTLITAGRFKGEGWPWFPLSTEARDHRQSMVDAYHSLFIRAVARGRNALQTDVLSGFGQGRMVLAQEAVKLRMADRVATLDAEIQRAFAGRSSIGVSSFGQRRAAQFAERQETGSGFGLDERRRRLRALLN